MMIDRGAELAAQAGHDFEDLRLDGDVERGGWLVGEEELRVAGKRHGDHHALAHAAGELVRVVVEAVAGFRDADHLEQLRRTLGAAEWSIFRCSSSASVSWRPMVSTGLSEVMGSWKIMAMRLPRIWRISSSSSLRRSSPSKMISPATILPGRIGDEPHDRECGDALAAAGLADEAEGLALFDVIRDAVDRVDDAVLGEELRLEIADLQ